MKLNVGYLGLALIIVGATLLASPTLGFEAIAADRTTQVETAPDESALIGFEAKSESINDIGGTATVFTIHNNADEPLDFTVDTSSESGAVEVATSGSGEVPSNGTTDVVLQCNGESGTGTATVTTTVTQAIGETITVSGASSSTTLDYHCTTDGGGKPGTGPVSFAANDPKHDGTQWNQVFEVNVDDFKSKQEFTIHLGDAQSNSGIDYSLATAEVTSGQDNRKFEFDKDSWTIIYTAQGKTDGPFEITVSNVQLTSDQGGTVTYTDSTGENDSDIFAVPAVANDGGSTDTSGDAWVENGSSTNGQIQAGGDVIVGDSAFTNSQVDADGDIVAGADVTMQNGNVEAEGSITLGDNTSVNTQLQAAGDIVIGTDARLQNGQVQSTNGDVVLGSGTTILTQVQAPNGDVYIGDDTSVQRQVSAGGTIYYGCNVDEDNLNGQTQSTC